ncbi:MAG: hypothetical protein ACREJ6_14965, partial [Candidatus Methylomirabilis sp.]
LVVPGPVLVSRPLHDIYGWLANKLDNDPSLGETLFGAALGSVFGPVGALIGAALPWVKDKAVELLLKNWAITEYDLELWPFFPKSFDEMLSLLEDLADGRGTNRKPVIVLIAGDVHHSYVMRGILARSRRRTMVTHFTMSPMRRLIPKGEKEKYKDLMAGKPEAAHAVMDRPGFVEEQMRRLEWFPIRLDGSRAATSKVDDWAFFGTFVGWLHLDTASVSFRYDQAHESTSGPTLAPIGGSPVYP